MNEEVLIQITAPHFCAGITIKEYKVIEVAPIVHYMKDWTMDRVIEYCKTKSWRLEIVNEH